MVYTCESTLHKPILRFDGRTPVSYFNATAPSEVQATRENMLKFIREEGYSPETTVMLAPFAECDKSVVVIDPKGICRSLGGDYKDAFPIFEIQPHDDVNVMNCEGVLTFQGHLVMLKVGDCFSLLISANTRQGPCVGIVHARRRPVVCGSSTSWIKPLLSMCDDPSDISVTISPGLQAPRNCIHIGYDDSISGCYKRQREALGSYASERDDMLYLDIPGYIGASLNAAGIHNVTNDGRDTYEMQQRGMGYSYRYAMNHGAPNNRNITAIHR